LNRHDVVPCFTGQLVQQVKFNSGELDFVDDFVAVGRCADGDVFHGSDGHGVKIAASELRAADVPAVEASGLAVIPLMDLAA